MFTCPIIREIVMRAGKRLPGKLTEKKEGKIGLALPKKERSRL